MRGLLVAHLVLVSREAAEPIEDLNMAPPPTPILKEEPPRITSSASPSLCSCDDSNNTNSFLEHAKTMKEAMRNKTTLLSKIRHRTTHSHDAVWASISLTLVVTLLVVGVLHSRMWQQRPHVSSMDSQPIKFIQWNPLAEIKVKRLLRSRGRALLGMFGGREGSQGRNTSSLRMEDFMTAVDTVDGVHRALLASSSDESWDAESEVEEEEEEEVVFEINKRTGEWEGEESVSLLGGAGRRRRRRRRKTSSESSGSMIGLNSAVSWDLVRLSSEDEDNEMEMMVKVG